MTFFFVLISCGTETKSTVIEESLVEDNDGGGFAAYEDCDDNNSLINASMKTLRPLFTPMRTTMGLAMN